MRLPQTQADFQPKYAPVTVAYRAYGIGASTLYKLIAEGRVRSTKLGKRRLVELASLDAVFEENAA